MKKSQTYSQVFIYILTIILISFILVYGYNSIKNFKERADKLSCLNFRNELKTSVDLLTGDFGSVRRKDLQLCSGYTEVCFVETFRNFDKNNPTFNINSPDPVILDSISSGTGKNAYLVGGESFYIGEISLKDKDVVCLKEVNNKISLRLEGMGNHVLLGQWGNSN